MFKSLLNFLKNLFAGPTLFDELESYIVAGNPQSAADVEHLERGFYERQNRQMLWHFKE